VKAYFEVIPFYGHCLPLYQKGGQAPVIFFINSTLGSTSGKIGLKYGCDRIWSIENHDKYLKNN
jgi:hypothetical protein